MQQRLPAYTGLTLGVVVGTAAAILGALVAGNPLQAAALPAAIVLFFFLVLDRRKLLFAILAVRSAGDVVFEATKVTIGGYHIGVGGIVNAVVILIVVLMVAEKPQEAPRQALAAWAAFLLAALASLVITPVKADAIRIYLSLLSYFAIFVSAFYVVRSREDFNFCVRLILWSSVLPAIYALVELAGGGAHRADGFRLQSTFPHPNIFAFYLTLVTFLTFYLLKSGAQRLSAGARAGLTLYMALLLSLLVLTQTRSAWIACFTIFAIYGILFERRYLAYVAAAPLLALLIPSVQDRLLDLNTGNEYVQYARLNSFAWRRLIWETGLQWMRPEHYVIGYGLESFRHYSLIFFPLASPTGAGYGAHNVYVQILFEIGVVGLLAWLWLVSRLLGWLRSLYSFDRLAAVVALSLTAAYLITSFSDNMLGYLSYNWYFWFFAGAAAALTTSSMQRRRKVPPAGSAAPAVAAGMPR